MVQRGQRLRACAAEFLEIEDLSFGCFSKSASLPVSVDFTVDDSPHIVGLYGGYHIARFDGDPDDGELWRVVEALRRSNG